MIKYYLYTILLACVTALYEIQIEGSDGGWAKNLPTFRIHNRFKFLLGNKPLTGYHICLLSLFFIVFHGTFLNMRWTIFEEMKTLGLYFWFFVIEDFMWFVFNPSFSVKRFFNRDISWHSRWTFGLPTSYVYGIIIGTTLLILGGLNA